MHIMEPGSMQDGDGSGVVNMTRAREALSPWLNNPRKTIIKAEGLVVAAAVLLLFQLILGSFRRRWHNSFIKYGLQVCNGIMFPLIIYTLGTMQSSPVKNSAYPIWAGFLIMASAGTTAVRQYDFCDSLLKKFMQNVVFLGYGNKQERMEIIRTQAAAESTEETTSANDDSDPHSIKGYKYEVCNRLFGGPITIDQIWDSCGNSDDGNALKDLCLSYALSRRLWRQPNFGLVSTRTSSPKDRDFVFKKLLPPAEEYFQRAFRVIEVELGFCYDFFFTKYYYTFFWTHFFPGTLIGSLILTKIIAILVAVVVASRRSLVLETPNPIIEVHISEVDWIITLLVLGIALLVELVQAAFYLASNWVQVSLACSYVKKNKACACIGKTISLLRKFISSGALRKKIDQHSVFFGRKDPVDVSDTVKGAIARSLRSTYGNQSDEETSLRQIHMFDWTFNDYCSQLEVMLIWHIATEYCDMSDDHRNGITRDEQGLATKWSIFWASLIGQGNGITPDGDGAVKLHWSRLCAQLIESIYPSSEQYPQNEIATRDGRRGVAIHLSRYCAHLIGSVPELLPYHEADIAELAQKMMEQRLRYFGSYYIFADCYDEVKNLEETEEHHNPRTVIKKGVKLGKQLEKMADDQDRWKVMEDFWADAIIHAAALPYTTKQHMQRLENGGEFLTHIWALLAHAGILDGDEDQQGRGVRIPVLRVPVKQEADLGPGTAEEEIA